MLTYRKLPPHSPRKDTIKLSPVLEPVPAHHGHAHRPQAPAQKGHHAKLLLGKVAAAAKHAGAHGQGLDHVKVAPADVIGNDNGRLALGQRVIAGDVDAGSIGAGEDLLDKRPDAGGDGGGDVVYSAREEELEREEGREGDVGGEEVEDKGDSESSAAEVGEDVTLLPSGGGAGAAAGAAGDSRA